MTIAQAAIATSTIAATHRCPAGSLPYRLILPRGYHPARAYPVLVFLHGKGERGTDNLGQLGNGFADFALGWLRDHHDAIIIAPQCPDTDQWVVRESWFRPHILTPQPTPALATAIDLIASIERSHRIDPTRRYVCGLSMGGYGTWELLARFPGRFAGAVPVCGGADPTLAMRIAQTPVTTIHGGADPVVPVDRSREIVAALRELRANITYHELPGVRHDAWWPAWKMTSVWGWLFRQ